MIWYENLKIAAFAMKHSSFLSLSSIEKEDKCLNFEKKW